MAESIAPDVDYHILGHYETSTVLSTFDDTDGKTVEIIEPFENVSFQQGFPFIAVIERTDGQSSVREVGYLEYTSRNHGSPTLSVLLNYSGLPQDDNLSTDERDFIEALITNQYDPTGPLPIESNDWDSTLYTGNHIITQYDSEEIRRTGETIFSNNLSGLPDLEFGFSAERRDQLIDATISMLTGYARTFADLNPENEYLIREAKFHDFHDRAIELYLHEPQLTETQAVTWALMDMGLSQKHIATLRDKSEPTISDHLSRAARHYVHASKTGQGFKELSPYIKLSAYEKAAFEIAEERAREEFRFTKTKKAVRAKCPECGLDAGQWDGGKNTGGWVNDPVKFWEAAIDPTPDDYQSPEDFRHVECPECGYFAHRREFNKEWVSKHGEPPYERPEKF